MHHRDLDALSLAYHRAVAAKLASTPDLRTRALQNVTRWLSQGSLHPVYASQWLSLLHGPLDALCAALTDTSDHAIALRQSSPFAGTLSAQERWAIRRAYTLSPSP